jgi:hypothetical protein
MFESGRVIFGHMIRNTNPVTLISDTKRYIKRYPHLCASGTKERKKNTMPLPNWVIRSLKHTHTHNKTSHHLNKLKYHSSPHTYTLYLPMHTRPISNIRIPNFHRHTRPLHLHRHNRFPRHPPHPAQLTHIRSIRRRRHGFVFMRCD